MPASPARASRRTTGSPAARRGLPGGEHLGDLAHGLLAVAEHHEVEEGGDGLGVVGAVAAGADEQVVAAAVGGPDRAAGQVDHVEEVRVRQLGREVEGQDVEVGGRAVGVDREQGQVVGPRAQRLEVGPRRVGALGDGVGALVEDLVEDLEALVGQPDLVGVGVRQQPGRPWPGGARGPGRRPRRRCSAPASTRGAGSARAEARWTT